MITYSSTPPQICFSSLSLSLRLKDSYSPLRMPLSDRIGLTHVPFMFANLVIIINYIKV